MQLSHYFAATDVGLQRNNNEDAYLSLPFLGVWAVADGMGGHAAGEVASAIVCDTLRKQIAKGATLAAAIQQSHKEVLEAAERGVGGAGMGSTLVALQSKGNHYEICWVGDSRAYLFNPSEDQALRQISRDHSYVQLLVDSGAISEDDVSTHPEKNIITQCLGSIDLEEVDVGCIDGSWRSNEWVLLCSDGLSDAVDLAQMQEIMQVAENVEQATTNLIRAALNNGGRDNITVQIISNPNSWTQLVQNAVRYVRKILG
ncbi:protein phosphatase [Alteromonadaceae bacterium Bs31]|nr:protein phosphatase [Alteromonadaceae bacterium Bs31]